MSTTHDEVAGVVDLFGALTRSELAAALDELAFKQGQSVDDAALQSAIESAVDAYALVAYDPADDAEGDDSVDDSETSDSETSDGKRDDPLLAVGPTAFSTLPPNAEDLPHILEYDRRSVDRERLATQVNERLTAEAEAAVDAEDTERAAELLDVSYDVESWASVKTEDIRSTLQAVLPQD